MLVRERNSWASGVGSSHSGRKFCNFFFANVRSTITTPCNILFAELTPYVEGCRNRVNGRSLAGTLIATELKRIKVADSSGVDTHFTGAMPPNFHGSSRS